MVLVLSLMLQACGFKGPLVLPDASKQQQEKK
jgi:predicted small lipoprotein YifL